MDNKKAIRELEILKEDYWEDDGYGHETKQYDDTMLAIDMAIEALKNKEAEKERIIKELQREELDNSIKKEERQSHDWKKTGFSVVDEHGTVVYYFVCENCRKIKEDLYE